MFVCRIQNKNFKNTMRVAPGVLSLQNAKLGIYKLNPNQKFKQER